MSRIGYYLFLKPLSLLPLSVLYFITQPLFWIFVHIIRYREKVIIGNLRNSFPEKNDKELHQIKRRFYRHFIDQLLETLHQISMTPKEGLRRFHITNPEVVQPFFDEGRHVAMMIGHYNNWEYLAYMNLLLDHRFVAIYASLRNKFLDGVVKNLRTCGDAIMVNRNDLTTFVRNYEGRPFIIFFAADQSPKYRSKLHWSTFLNQESAFPFGGERYSKMMNMGVVFADIQKVKRGHYELTFEIIAENPKETETGEITESYVRLLEKQIQNKPEYWLWSHKRWKGNRKRPETK